MSTVVSADVSICGPMGAGKTTLACALANEPLPASHLSTVGMDIKSVSVIQGETSEEDFRLRLWDLAGDKRFASIVTSFIRPSHLVLVVVSSADEDHLDAVRGWLTVAARSGCMGTHLVYTLMKGDTEQRGDSTGSDDGAAPAEPSVPLQPVAPLRPVAGPVDAPAVVDLWGEVQQTQNIQALADEAGVQFDRVCVDDSVDVARFRASLVRRVLRHRARRRDSLVPPPTRRSECSSECEPFLDGSTRRADKGCPCVIL